MKEHDVMFIVRNTISKKEICKKDFDEAQKVLDLKRKLNPRSKWILLCKVV